MTTGVWNGCASEGVTGVDPCCKTSSTFWLMIWAFSGVTVVSASCRREAVFWRKTYTFDSVVVGFGAINTRITPDCVGVSEAL